LAAARRSGNLPAVPGDRATRPMISANQVTVARLIPMPAVAWLIYQGMEWWWLALILATIIGATDYLDGYLARKQGPTVLGGLLDPIADKVFIALIYLPLADLGYLPMWVVGLMFVREFLVTAMRSAYAYRGVSFATSYLAKMKTWVQMQGVGLLVLIGLVEDRRIMMAVLIAQLVGPALAVAIIAATRKRHWKSGTATIFFIAILTGLYATGDLELTILGSLLAITALTWASGLDYLVGGLPRLRAARPWDRADGVRLFGAFFLVVAVVGTLGWTAAPALPVLAIAALELAVGGLDNLLAVHKEYAPARWWGVRTWGTALLCALAFLAEPTGVDALAVAGPWAAVVLCAAGVGREFWRGRVRYMDRTARHAA
jgi:CDP-diacylglycerol--glycerol-3-phosphate 3-phosphatidyltransferase